MLSTALRANALFSTLSALIFVFGASQVARLSVAEEVLSNLTWDPALVVQVTGIGLIGFAAYCFWLSLNEFRSTNRAMGVIAADLAWVMASGVALYFFPDVFSGVGVTIIGGISAAVLGFALWQWAGLRSVRE